jgi:hypothetical protein
MGQEEPNIPCKILLTKAYSVIVYSVLDYDTLSKYSEDGGRMFPLNGTNMIP